MPHTGGAASDKPGDAHREKHTTNIKRTSGDGGRRQGTGPGPAGGESLVRVPDRSAGMNDE